MRAALVLADTLNKFGKLITIKVVARRSGYLIKRLFLKYLNEGNRE